MWDDDAETVYWEGVDEANDAYYESGLDDYNDRMDQAVDDWHAATYDD